MGQGARWGAYLSDVDLCDPLALGLARPEALLVDPQQVRD